MSWSKFGSDTTNRDDGRWSAAVRDMQAAHDLGRNAGHPCNIWHDDIEALAGGSWADPERRVHLVDCGIFPCSVNWLGRLVAL